MGYGEVYGGLLKEIAEEADAIAMRYFRGDGLRVDRKGDGTAVTQADRAVEEMARAKVAASGLPLDVLGEEMGGGDTKSPSASGRARMIIDPIDGTEEFSRGIPTFGTLIGIESNGEIVAAMVRAPGLHSRWWAYRGNDFAVRLNSYQGPKSRDAAREFFRAIDRVDDHTRPPGSARRLRIAAAHLFSKNVQRQPASRHFRTSHFFHGSVRLRHRGSVALAVDAQLVPTKIAHRNRVRLLGNFFQQTSINFAVSHCFSLFEVHHRRGVFGRPVTGRKSQDLTPSRHTPSIQSYRNVCSSQHRNRAGPHSGSAARRGGPQQTRPPGDGAKVWRESGDAVARFSRGAVPRRAECSRGAVASFTFARRDSRTIRTGGAGA